LRFLLDVHISTRIARTLHDAGHDVVRAALLDPTAPDRELLALAVAEQRVVVTQDSDYSDLIFAWGCPPPLGIIYIRCSPAEQPGIAERVMETIAAARLEGHIAVVTPATTRYRLLPKVANDHA
jgi:predicted nuclease of predicted toxin-antitoxin system